MEQHEIETLNDLLNHISYGSNFRLEYNGERWRKTGKYGEWRCQFYDGYSATGESWQEAANKAWNMLPNRPSPFLDMSNFTPEAGSD